MSASLFAGELAYVWTRDPGLAPITVTIAACAGILLLYALLYRADDVMPWPVVLLGIAYAIPLFVRGSGIDEGAPLVGVGLLLCSELAVWSFDERWSIAAERAVVVARGTAVALLSLAGLGASALVLALAAAPIGGGLAWTALGAASAVVVVGLAARLGR